MNIVDVFDDSARKLAGQMALIDATGKQENTVSFSSLRQVSMDMAEALRRDGVQAGDRVLVAVPVSAILYAALLSIWRLGAVAVFPDPASSRQQLKDCCGMVAPKAFVGTPKAQLLRLLSPSIRRIPLHYRTSGWLPFTRRLSMQPGHAHLSPSATDSESPALVTFTSGSTGRPKAASRSHGFLMAQYRTVLATLALEPGQVDVTTLPVFVLANLAAGVTTLLPPGDLRKPGSIEGAPILDAIRRHGVTRASGSPAFFTQLARALATGSRPMLTTLHTGGAPVTPELMDRLAVMTVPGGVCAVYGSTEAEPIAELPATDLTDRHRAGPTRGMGLPAGRPVADISLRIIDNHWGQPLKELGPEAFDRMTLAAGETGEIVVSGDHVLPGYLNGEGDLDTKFSVDGQRWHRTGDAGYLDDTGGLWLMGRIGSAARIGDKTLYPFQVEYPAMAHPDVELAALLPLGEEPLLVLQHRAGSTPDIGAVIARLPVEFPPDRIQLVKEIPLDSRHNAKIDYGKLRKLVAPGD